MMMFDQNSDRLAAVLSGSERLAILQGDARNVLKGFPDESVNLCVCSPPYYSLRKYSEVEPSVWGDGWVGTLGNEPTPSLYISHVVEIFHEVFRVLRNDGSCFIVIGDSYAGAGGSEPAQTKWNVEYASKTQNAGRSRNPGQGYQQGELIGIPWLLAEGLRADGWLLRNDIVLAKSNPLPESVSGWEFRRHQVKIKARDGAFNPDQSYAVDSGHPSHGYGGVENRPQPEWADCPGCKSCSFNNGYILRKGSWRPSRSHEYILQFSKQMQYYADRTAVLEPLSQASVKRLSQPSFWEQEGGGKDYAKNGTNPNRSSRHALENLKVAYGSGNKERLLGDGNRTNGHLGTNVPWEADGPGVGRNMRDVLLLTRKPSKYKHSATFDEAVVKPWVLACTSEKGYCSICGEPWARVIERERAPEDHERPYKDEGQMRASGTMGGNGVDHSSLGLALEHRTTGWMPTCSCKNNDVQPGLVLDPFAGTGTTLAVALELGRSAIGIDASPAYIEIMEERFSSSLLTKAQQPV